MVSKLGEKCHLTLGKHPPPPCVIWWHFLSPHPPSPRVSRIIWINPICRRHLRISVIFVNANSIEEIPCIYVNPRQLRKFFILSYFLRLSKIWEKVICWNFSSKSWIRIRLTYFNLNVMPQISGASFSKYLTVCSTPWPLGAALM